MRNLLPFGLLILNLAATTGTADDAPPFRVTTKRSDDRVAVKLENGQATFSIRSRFGISEATLERTGPSWPNAVVVQLHLKGLENFRVTNGTLALKGSASIQNGELLLRPSNASGEEASPDNRRADWLEIRIRGADAQQANKLPLKSGYFEILLPKALFKDNPKSITASWIDFYRN